MKMILAFIISVFSVSAFAMTSLTITDEKATVIIKGNAEDTDAVSLFRAMNVDATDSEQFLEKTIQLGTKEQNPVFDLTCDLAKATEDLGSCTLVIYKSRFAKINTSKAQVAFGVGAFDAKDFVTKFNVVDPDMGGDVFLSHDDKLGIAIDGTATPRAILRIWIRAQ